MPNFRSIGPFRQITEGEQNLLQSQACLGLSGITLKANQIVSAARRGVFSDYPFQCLQKKAITVHVLGGKSAPLWRIFNN